MGFMFKKTTYRLFLQRINKIFILKLAIDFQTGILDALERGVEQLGSSSGSSPEGRWFTSGPRNQILRKAFVTNECLFSYLLNAFLLQRI